MHDHITRAIEEHRNALTRVALGLTKNATDAEDLVHDTTVLALRFGRRCRPDTNWRPWLLRIMKNHFISQIRRRKLEHTAVHRESQVLRQRCTSAAALRCTHADGGVQPGTFSPAVTRALDALPSVYREVLILCDVYEYSYQEAADALRIPLGTIMSRLHRARRHMRKQLDVRRAPAHQVAA